LGSEIVSIAVRAGTVYYTQAETIYDPSGENLNSLGRGAIMKVSVEGGPPVAVATEQPTPCGLAVDDTSVYWINYGGPAAPVMKAPLDGGPPETLVSGSWGRGGSLPPIAVDGSAVYWTDTGPEGNLFASPPQGRLLSVPLTGGPMSTIAEGLPGPFAVAVLDGTAYWTEWAYAPTGRVAKAPTGGGTTFTVASESVVLPFALTLHGTNAYWTTIGRYPGLAPEPHGAVMTTSIDGGQVTTLASGLFTPFSIAVDGANVYWASNAAHYYDAFDGQIQSVPLGGGDVTTIVNGLKQPFGIALDDQYVYWADRGFAERGSRVMRVAKGGGAPVTLTEAATLE
jgi:hypothetical protein